MLSGRDSLGLLPRHSARVHFTYLDPSYRATGARRRDSATVDDNVTPAYQPTLVLISENKDTAIHFPPLPSGIAVEGGGFGGKTAAAFPWLTNAPHLYYWGDIDTTATKSSTDGAKTASPSPASSWTPSPTKPTKVTGTNTDADGYPLKPDSPKPLPQLTPDERSVYNLLVDPGLQGHRRIEQERIPLRVAVDAITPSNL